MNANVGKNIPVYKIMDEFDAVVLCGGSTIPRKLNVKGEDLKGVHFAMEFLEQNNKRVAGDSISKKEELLATRKEKFCEKIPKLELHAHLHGSIRRSTIRELIESQCSTNGGNIGECCDVM